MKYIISTIGKIKNNDEDWITRKYLKRIRNVELKQYEVKTKNIEKKLDEEADKLINSTPKNGKLILLDEEGENISSSELAKLVLNWSNNNVTSVNFAIGGFIAQIILIVGSYYISKLLPREKTDREFLEETYKQSSLTGYYLRNLKFK